MAIYRKRHTSEQKAAIVRRHLVDGVSVADLAEEYGLASILRRKAEEI